MLNEITKGMSNAAEKINENFEKVEIGGGSNEQGSFLKFPDGSVICYIYEPSIYHDKNTTIRFPVIFKEKPVVIPGIYRPGGYNNLGIMMKSLTREYVSVIPTVTSGSLPTDNIDATIIAIGKIEE